MKAGKILHVPATGRFCLAYLKRAVSEVALLRASRLLADLYGELFGSLL